MTLSLSTMKKSGRAALVALAMGAVSMTAMPVQAASEPSFNFQLGIGSNGSVMGFELNNKKSKKWQPIKKCLSNNQVENALEWYGFDDADVVRKLSSTRVLVVAEWNNKFYSMTVNKCSGEVYNVKRLKKGYDFWDGPKKGPKGPKGGFGFEKDGFSFQFGIN